MESAVLAFDLGGTDLKAAWIDRSGRIERHLRLPSRTQDSAEAPFAAMREAADTLAGGGDAPAAIGLGCPGMIDPDSGALVATTAHLPHWRDLDLRARLAREFGRPVAVDNDANAAALAESRLGAARGARLAVVITLGTGIGCGIVVAGRLLRGAGGGAGELGHLPFGTGATACACGIERCLEPEASGSGLLRAARAAGLEVADAAGVFGAAATGNATARTLVDAMAERLGAALATAVNVLNPDVLVIGGGVSQAGAALFERIDRALARHALASHRRGLQVVPAAFGERAGVLGAGLLAWDALDAGSTRA
jgi:glucokinase